MQFLFYFSFKIFRFSGLSLFKKAISAAVYTKGVVGGGGYG